MVSGTNPNKLKPVTDPNLLSQLNARAVTDPNLLAQLEGRPQPQLQATPAQSVGNEFQSASQKLRQGSTIAGMAQGGNAALQGALLPLTYADQAIRKSAELPGAGGYGQIAPMVLDALGLIPKAGQWLGENVAKSGLGYAGILDHNLGTTPENAQQIRQEVPKLVGTVGSVVVPSVLPETIQTAKNAYGEVVAKNAVRSGERAIQGILDTYPPNKAPSAADRAVRYREEQIPTAAQYIATEARSEGIPQNIQEFGNMTEKIKQDIWNKVDISHKSYAQAVIDPSGVVDKIVSDLPDSFKKTYPDRVDEISQELSRFKQPYTMEQAQELIKGLNAEQKPVYDANGNRAYNTLKKDYVLNAEKQFTDGLRAKFFDTAESYGDKSIEPLRKDFGAVSTLNNEVHGAMERNMAKDKKSVIDGSLKKGFYAGVLAKISGLNPHLAGAIDVGVTGGKIISNIRSKPSNMISRSVGQLSKSNLEAPQYEYTPPDIRGLLPESTGRSIPSNPTVRPPLGGWKDYGRSMPSFETLPDNLRMMPSGAEKIIMALRQLGFFQ